MKKPKRKRPLSAHLAGIVAKQEEKRQDKKAKKRRNVAGPTIQPEVDPIVLALLADGHLRRKEN